MKLEISRQRSAAFTRTQWIAVVCLVLVAFEIGVRVARQENAEAKAKPKPTFTNHPMTAPTAIVDETPTALQTGEVMVAAAPSAPPPRTNRPPTEVSPVGPGPVPQMKNAHYGTRKHRIPEQRRVYYPITNVVYGIRVAVP